MSVAAFEPDMFLSSGQMATLLLDLSEAVARMLSLPTEVFWKTGRGQSWFWLNCLGEKLAAAATSNYPDLKACQTWVLHGFHVVFFNKLFFADTLRPFPSQQVWPDTCPKRRRSRVRWGPQGWECWGSVYCLPSKPSKFEKNNIYFLLLLFSLTRQKVPPVSCFSIFFWNQKLRRLGWAVAIRSHRRRPSHPLFTDSLVEICWNVVWIVRRLKCVVGFLECNYERRAESITTKDEGCNRQVDKVHRSV